MLLEPTRDTQFQVYVIMTNVTRVCSYHKITNILKLLLARGVQKLYNNNCYMNLQVLESTVH
jgi:nickel-dependent lactate racemase